MKSFVSISSRSVISGQLGPDPRLFDGGGFTKLSNAKDFGISTGRIYRKVCCHVLHRNNGVHFRRARAIAFSSDFRQLEYLTGGISRNIRIAIDVIDDYCKECPQLRLRTADGINKSQFLFFALHRNIEDKNPGMLELRHLISNLTDEAKIALVNDILVSYFDEVTDDVEDWTKVAFSKIAIESTGVIKPILAELGLPAIEFDRLIPEVEKLYNTIIRTTY